MATCKTKNCGHTMITNNISYGAYGKRALLICPYCKSTQIELNDVDITPEELRFAQPAPRPFNGTAKRRKLEAILNKYKVKGDGNA